jgi:2-enoate reductase
MVPALQKKKVLIAGGGPAGMEVARATAMRGHDVVLCEAGDKLGGNLIPGGQPSFKQDDLKLIEWYEEQLRRLGVDVRLNTKVTKEMVEEGEWDDVVIATGSIAKKFPLADERTYLAKDVLLGNVDPGKKVVIVGGGLVGCELALHLGMNGAECKIVESLPDILLNNPPKCPANLKMLLNLLDQYKVERIVGASLDSFEDGIVTVTKDGEKREIEATSVVECVGFVPNGDLYEELRFVKPFVHRIGDCQTVDSIMGAIWQGWELGRNI